MAEYNYNYRLNKTTLGLVRTVSINLWAAFYKNSYAWSISLTWQRTCHAPSAFNYDYLNHHEIAQNEYNFHDEYTIAFQPIFSSLCFTVNQTTNDL